MSVGGGYDALMREAIAASYGAVGLSSPNPPVGAAVYDSQGVLLATGHTQKPGCAHAEVVALTKAGEHARGGTLVVTLEPCDHYGRTPPCTQAILASGVSRVVFGVTEPTPVASAGAARLTQAGIEVIPGVLAPEIASGPLKPWLHYVAHKRPFITGKIAMSLDGRITREPHTQLWLTGEESRVRAHQLRSQCDGIMIGTTTAIVDNPRLNVRLGSAAETLRHPTRIIVGDTPIPADHHVHDGSGPTVFLPHSSPENILAALPGSLHLLIEGGPTLLSAFLAAKLIDELYIFISPTILATGIPAFPAYNAAVRDMTIQHVEQLGSDALIIAECESAASLVN